MNVLLTGVTGGIGSAIQRALENAGHTLVLADRHAYDLSSPETVKRLASEAPPVDVIVCAHGYIDDTSSFTEQSINALQTTFAVNTLSVAYLAKYFPNVDMIALSSTAALHPNGKYPAYSASKAALNTLMQNLARQRSEVRYIAICPGATNTKMREKIAHDAAQHQSPSVIAEVVLSAMQKKGEYRSGDILSVKDGKVEIVSRID